MCGIAGYLGDPNPHASDRVLAMLRAQLHRGPDGAGLAAVAGGGAWRTSYARGVDALVRPDIPAAACVLGHNWLAIQDPAPSAAQPMVWPSPRLALTFNGEIYNFVELRDELAREGQAFATGSDTEVLLALIARRGIAATLSALRGMFAFAAYDPAAGELWLARDPFGIKPLYHATRGNAFYFASEVRSLHAGGVPRALRPGAALASAAAGVNKFHETQTLYEHVEELPPGCWLRATARDGHVRLETGRYYDLPGLRADLRGDAATDLLRAALDESVRVHLRARRRVATCLSGGLDSTNLACLIARHVPNPQEFATFTVRTAGPDQSELEAAADVAAAAKLRHVTLDQRSAIPAADVLEMVTAYEVPNHVIGPINQFLLLREIAASGATVVLDGQGGDELMSGYPWYAPVLADAVARQGGDAAGLRAQFGRRLPFDPATARQFDTMFHDAAAWVAAFVWQPDGQFLGVSRNDVLASPETQYYLAGGGDWAAFRRRMYYQGELQYLLRQEDRLGMWFGLECRVPFVDAPLVAAAARLAPDWLVHDGYLKYPLRVLLPELPESVRWNTKKKGFWETDRARFDWVAAAGRRLALASPVLRQVLPNLEAGYDYLSFDQHWRLLQLAVLERCATRADAVALAGELRLS